MPKTFLESERATRRTSTSLKKYPQRENSG